MRQQAPSLLLLLPLLLCLMAPARPTPAFLLLRRLRPPPPAAAWTAARAAYSKGHCRRRLCTTATGTGGGDGADGGITISPSPVQRLQVWGREVFVKRDDELDLLAAGVYGNKARKLLTLAQRGLDGQFPPVVVSHGGVQSNALAALAGLLGPHGGRFPRTRLLYFCKPVPGWLRNRPLGTYARALALGVEFRELQPPEYKAIFGGEDEEQQEGELVSVDEIVARLRAAGLVSSEEEMLFVPQGGAFPGADTGVQSLGREIRLWWDAEKCARKPPNQSLAVVLPAGTGTTALGLAKALMGDSDVTVYAVPCVGEGGYLRRQMRRLAGGGEAEGDKGVWPVVLEGGGGHVFARPEKELLEIWRSLRREAGLTLDLIYGPQAWRVIRAHWPAAADDGAWGFPSDGKQQQRRHTALLYVHTGGLEGLASQLGRYRHLEMLEPGDEEGVV